jgi:hypothetical protein
VGISREVWDLRDGTPPNKEKPFQTRKNLSKQGKTFPNKKKHLQTRKTPTNKEKPFQTRETKEKPRETKEKPRETKETKKTPSINKRNTFQSMGVSSINRIPF